MTKAENYELALSELSFRFEKERDMVSNLSNASAILKAHMDDVNWLGFYIHKNSELVLGPFQGLAAVSRIKSGIGVCGTALMKDEVQLVPDVHAFPGHIACDLRSRSEIVVPVRSGGKITAVLDIDSPVLSRFDEEDKKYLIRAAELIGKSCEW